ncbi:FmdB family zinc ribbon protein [Mycobacterium sp. pV006]|uniref:FmdB family zinc ribbon protein n=1 Tax=Mycobacterium sp. pV006 TaxID=3238983 RepID=UPI00351BD23F
MVLYTYRCDSGCGVTAQMHPMRDRPDVVDCPTCSGLARRTMSAPHLGRSGTAMALHDATRASADQPGVVNAPPSSTRRQRTTVNPLHRTLPRP